MTLLISYLVRQYANNQISYGNAVEQFNLTEAEQKELIVIVKSMELYHGQTTSK